ncbi:uncharacterized protein LOC123501098 isoform X3 [Portunus trituberculatus]|uniref:uncharacterized protein LOC123501098 isoform X3 n=1 Tax=Portunus trituberculatus TaxID=210409 RepID=UPI001E1D098C|nr:uncharacterized protein LOC123501098 isoform X3 [Portunus trituberculatus]
MAGGGGGVAADDVSMAGFHDKNSRVVGTWKIIECVSLSGSSEATGIEGTEFVLSEAGDVTWSVTDSCDSLPLFSCQMYEVYTYQNLQCYGNRTLLRFAAYNGHIIEFRLDQPVMSRDLMLLTYDGWFMLQCEKLGVPDVSPDLPYSLLPALSDGYFSDITITAKSGRKFEVHSIILQSSVPDIEWKSLEGMEDPALETVLHYLYTRCLPPTLTPETAQRTLDATAHLVPALTDLKEKCEVFIRNTALRNRLVSLMEEVQECVEVMVQIFNPTDPAATSPTHLISVLKAALRQMAIGVVKVVELSQEFERCGWRLTQSEQHEVMRYTRSCLPPLLVTVVRLLGNVRASLVALNHHKRQQLAQQLVPEISAVLQTVCVDVGSLRTSLEHIIQASSTSLESSHSPTHLLAKSLRNDLHLRELQKLRILQENLTSFLNSLVHKREQFEEMGGGARVRGVARIINHFTEELMVLTLRLEEVAVALEDMLEWSEFKFVFKGATSKVGSIVERLVEHRGVMEALVLEMVERVGHPAFTTSLQHLGLLAPSQHPSAGESPSPVDLKGQEFRSSPEDPSSPGDADTFADSASRPSCPLDQLSSGGGGGGGSSRQQQSLPQPQQHSSSTNSSSSQSEGDPLSDDLPNSFSKLSLVRRVCEPPPSRTSPLALNVARLLTSPMLSDMTFVVVPPADDETSPSSSLEDLHTMEGQDARPARGASKDSYSSEWSEHCTPSHPGPPQPSCTTTSTTTTSVSTSAMPKVSSTVVRKVKKSLSLDHRPSARVSLPSHAYSLDCDAVSCGSDGGLPIASPRTRESSSDRASTDLATAAVCDGSVKSVREEEVEWGGRGKVAAAAVLPMNCDNSGGMTDSSSGVTSSPCMGQAGQALSDYKASAGPKELPVSVGSKGQEEEGCVTREAARQSKHLEETRPRLSDGEAPTSSGKSDRKGRLTKSPNIVIEDGLTPTKPPEPSVSPAWRGQRGDGTPWEGVELHAHRVVVAARCEWFRRALLSGMREAIDRCIVVHGCSVHTFQLLLQFLYAGHVDCSALPPDQLVDLLVLADHYGVDALKLLVESGLEQHVDDDSVVPLLTVAHHCNAAHLKEVCVHHCVVSAVVLEGETLTQLPEDLRHHLTLALGKHRKWWTGAIGEEVLVGGEGVGGGEDSPLSVSSTDPLIDDPTSLIHPLQQCGMCEDSTGEGSGGGGGGSRLEAVVQQLREVVGQQVPRTTLIQITLAADYDLNRALNFFFTNSSSSSSSS